MLFATKDKKLLEELAKENCSHLTPDEFTQLFQHATQEPHSFMLCDFKSNEVRKNFDEVLKIQWFFSLLVSNGKEAKAKREKTTNQSKASSPINVYQANC